MVQLVGIAILVAVLAAAAWILLGGAQAAVGTSSLLWMVELRDGKVQRFEGEFPPRGWRDVHDIATAGAITGAVRYRSDGTVEFTGDIEADDRQRIRNVLGRGPSSGCIPGPKG